MYQQMMRTTLIISWIMPSEPRGQPGELIWQQSFAAQPSIRSLTALGLVAKSERTLERSAQILEMRAAADAAVRGAESAREDATRYGAIERTFSQSRPDHSDHAYAWSTEQVVNVPMQGLLRAQMAHDPRFQRTLCGPGIHVAARRKLDLTQPADRAAHRPRHFNQELIADLTRHALVSFTAP